MWKLFADLDLSDASKSRFRSLHDCFTRELKPGARPIDSDARVLVSPCDAIVGARGRVHQGMVLQAKGFPYRLEELLGDAALAGYYEAGEYVTLRLASSMYHRFHAPEDCLVELVSYFSGDTFNVNAIALRRVERLFCKNERAVIRCRLPDGKIMTLVPVAAILVASIRLRFLDVLLHLKYRGPQLIPCAAQLQRGEEMGWFEHGSTLLAFVPAGFASAPDPLEGSRVRVGQALFTKDLDGRR